VKDGIELEDGIVHVDDFSMIDTIPGHSLVRVTLHEGRNRIVRRLFAQVGFPVEALVRTDIGEVALGDQRPGSLRGLTRKEIAELYKAVGM
jgi:23S rRNA pseudouridine2605 synthase